MVDGDTIPEFMRRRRHGTRSPRDLGEEFDHFRWNGENPDKYGRITVRMRRDADNRNRDLARKSPFAKVQLPRQYLPAISFTTKSMRTMADPRGFEQYRAGVPQHNKGGNGAVPANTFSENGIAVYSPSSPLRRE